MDEDLIIVKHCEKIACSSPPKVCPLCHKLINYNTVPAPSYLPEPFRNAHAQKQRFSIVLKPTTGTWNDAATSENDLHIGVTDSIGLVANYWWSGVMSDTKGWEKCLVVYQISHSDAQQWDHIWSSVLDTSKTDLLWSPSQYEELSHNCFDFVLEFLKEFCREVEKRCGRIEELGCLLAQLQTGHLTMKEAFTQEHVLPKLTQAASYVHLNSSVKASGFAKIA